MKKAMMVVAVGFAAVTFAGCEVEAAEDTVTVDVGTAAIEENVDADDEEDPLPTATRQRIGDGGAVLTPGAVMVMELHRNGFGYLSDQITEEFSTEFIDGTCAAFAAITTADEYHFFFTTLASESGMDLGEVFALVSAAVTATGEGSECRGEFIRVMGLVTDV